MTLLLSMLLGMLLMAAVLGLVVWNVTSGEARAAAMLDQWLRDHDYQLLQKSAPWIKDNPFFGGSNRSQKVFKVTIRTPDGTVRAAWLRCGHALWGVVKDQVEVKWDDNFQPDETSAQTPP